MGTISENITIFDKLVFAALLLLTFFLFQKAYFNLKVGSFVIVEVNNKVFGKYPLDKDRDIKVTGNLGITGIEIFAGRVKIKNSPCRNKMCVKFGKINKVGRVSVCLPNKVVIKIIGDEASDFDAILR